MMGMFTLIDDGRPVSLEGRVERGRVWLPRDALATLGWAPGSGAEGRDLGELARALDRPLALDPEESAADLGVSARARAETLLSLEAPDFTLPDLDGRLHTLSALRGRKVFLVAYGSW
jgi:hypothetical protein